MAEESVTIISDLVVTNPTDSDARRHGATHLRAIKVAVKSLLTNLNQIKVGPASLTGKAGQLLKVNAGETGFDELVQLVDNETLTHAGSGTSLTLAGTPSPAASLKLFRNGVFLRQGVGKDYTISGATITLTIAIVADEWFVAFYRK